MTENKNEHIKLEELNKRVSVLKKKYSPKAPNSGLNAAYLVLSMGFSVAITIYGGYWVGTLLKAKYSSDIFIPICLLVSIVFAGYIVYNLLKPFLK